MSSDQLSQAYSISAYLRVASIAVALYDYLETQPTAWRFYKQQWVARRISLSAVLFVLLRFVSIITLTLSNVGFFYYHFSPAVCRQYFLLAPAFKVMQTMISQLIIGVRAFNLSRRSKVVATFLIFIYVIACTLQWVTTMFQRSPRLGDRYGREIDGAIGNCGAFNERKLLGAWIHYAVAIIYDIVVTAISICYLLKFKLAMNNSMLSKVTKMMLYDGLGYLVMLTAVNILNLVLYRTSRDIQNAGASLGYCVSWIMSQRLLIHLHNAQRERRLDSLNNIVTLSQSRNSAYDNSGVFPNGENKSSDFELTQPEFDIETGSPESMSSAPVGMNRVIHMCKKHTRPRSAVTQ